MNDNNIHDMIQAYEEGALSEKDRLNFEKQLKTDSILAKTWQLHQEVNRSISNPKVLEMEDLLNDLGNEFSLKYKQEEVEQPTQVVKKSRIRPMYWLAIAASLALLVLAWWQFGTTNNIDTQALYAEAYVPYSVSDNIRSINDVTDTSFQKGQKKYQLGEYTSALALFSSVLDSDSLSEEQAIATHFYKGMTHLGLNETDLAKQSLETTLIKPEHIYTQQAQWYLALIALKNNDVEMAKNNLNKTINIAATGKYGQKATKLLERLK